MIRGGGEAARRGILMRSGEAFQLMGQLHTAALTNPFTGKLLRRAGQDDETEATPSSSHEHAHDGTVPAVSGSTPPPTDQGWSWLRTDVDGHSVAFWLAAASGSRS